MKSVRRICLILFLALSITAVGCKVLQEDLAAILNTGSGVGGALDEPTVIAGIKEALRVGTGNTVLSASSVDGFLGNQLIRILIPEQLESMAMTLRKIGLGGEVDKLETGMNRAAELAAGYALHEPQPLPVGGQAHRIAQGDMGRFSSARVIPGGS